MCEEEAAAPSQEPRVSHHPHLVGMSQHRARELPHTLQGAGAAQGSVHKPPTPQAGAAWRQRERWRQPAPLLGFPASCVVTATVIITIIIIIKDQNSKGEHISKKGQVIINTTQHLPSAVQPRSPLLMFSHAHREGEILAFPFFPQWRKHEAEVKQAMAC